jgi:hypothetical protein
LLPILPLDGHSTEISPYEAADVAEVSLTEDFDEVSILNPAKRSLQKDLVVSSMTSAVVLQVTISDH